MTNGSHREEDCLTRENVVDELVDRALAAIRAAANDGSLLQQKELLRILFRWRDFLNNDPAEVRTWTDRLLGNHDALVVLAKQLTGEPYSQSVGLFGLGDRVSRRTVQAQIDEKWDMLDVAAFRSALERLQTSGTLNDERQKIVDDFLAAWQRKREGRDE